MPEDIAFISSKSDVHPRRYYRDIDPTAKCGQTAFQLYNLYRLRVAEDIISIDGNI